MIARGLLVIGLFLALQTASALAGETPLQQSWGTSFETQKQLQIANPEGVATSASPAGLDGGAAAIIVDKYRRSFMGSKSGTTGGASSGGEVEPVPVELVPSTGLAAGVE